MKNIDPSPTVSAMSAAERALQEYRADSSSLHPLELIPYFRRFSRSPLRIIILTLIFNCIIAAFFTVMALVFIRFPSWAAFGNTVLSNLITANLIGFIWALVMMMTKPLLNRINRMSFGGKIAGYTVFGFVVTQGAFMGISLLSGTDRWAMWARLPQSLAGTLAISLLISLALGFAFQARFSALERDAAISRESERRQIVERQAMQANLRALQAQIEPHFLFNTLANVVGLIHADPDKAKRMLEEFIVYLRATLASTRESETTLDQEFAMMKNFLAILQIRMGDRLRVRLDLPPQLSGMRVPPMLLQPLVENALRHGLEPKIDGGEIALSAWQEGVQLTLTVADTGLGFRDSMSQGIGLKNVRERLQQLYEGRASLLIEDNVPSGTRITLSIPCEAGLS